MCHAPIPRKPAVRCQPVHRRDSYCYPTSSRALIVAVFEQEILEEPANYFGRMFHLHFKDPQIRRRTNRNRGKGSVLVSAMRKLRQSMAGKLHIKNPAHVGGGAEGKIV